MGQSKYRKKNDPNYGRAKENEATSNLVNGFPEFYPEELIKKIESIPDELISEEKINKIYEHLGHLGEYCQRLVTMLDLDYYNIESMRVAFAALTSTRMGAFAYTSTGSEQQEKFDFIGINLGTPAILLSNFYKILSSPGSFVKYGNWEGEDQERAYHFLSNITDPDKDFVSPNCLIRKEVATILTQISLDFVLLHEATHLYHGHVDWIKENRSGESSAIESFNSSVMPSDDLAKQFFEVDADDCALQLTIANVLEYTEGYNQGKIKVRDEQKEAYNLVFGNSGLALRATLYSLYILHRGSDYELWHNNINKGSHPRGLLRARYMFNRFLEVTEWHGFGVGNKESFIDMCIAVIFEAENDIARMEGNVVDRQTFIDVMSSSNASLHIQEINKIQSILEDETCRFVRGDKFPGTLKMRSKKKPIFEYRGVRPSKYNRP